MWTYINFSKQSSRLVKTIFTKIEKKQGNATGYELFSLYEIGITGINFRNVEDL